MAVTEHISGIYSGIDAVPRRAASLAGSIKSLARFFVTWVDSCAEHYAAAAIYQQLSRLSDAELRKRGLSRDTLLRDVFLHLSSRSRRPSTLGSARNAPMPGASSAPT
jgi:hypothetical protein